MEYSKICPTCGALDCDANEEGRCIALRKNDFGNRKCPFYKTKEEAEKDRAKCEERLANIRKGMEV